MLEGLRAGLLWAIWDCLASGVHRTPWQVDVLILASGAALGLLAGLLLGWFLRHDVLFASTLAGLFLLQAGVELRYRWWGGASDPASVTALGVLVLAAGAYLLGATRTLRRARPGPWKGLLAGAPAVASLCAELGASSPVGFAACMALVAPLGWLGTWRLLSTTSMPARATLGGLTLLMLGFVSFAVAVAEPGPPDRTMPEPAQHPAPQGAPSVVLISIDTLRHDHVGDGRFSPGTPELDRIARQGIWFEQAVTPAPWTLPAHASLFTSLLPVEHGCVRQVTRLGESFVTMAEVFHAHGYETAAFTGGGFLRVETGLDQGFETFDQDGERRFLPFHVHAPLVWRWITRQEKPLLPVLRWIYERGGTRELSRKVERWLGSRDRSRPFFLFLHTYEVHDHHYHHPDLKQEAAWREQLSERFRGRLYVPQPELVEHATAADLALQQKIYQERIRHVDAQIGATLRDLEQAVPARRCITVITSDHGEGFSRDPERIFHLPRLTEDVLRVPLILRGAGLPEGVRVGEPVSLLDVLPTVLELAGLPVPESAQGRSLLACLRGERPFRPYSISEYGARRHRGVGLRTEEWKIALEPGGESAFHLPSDPMELDDRIQDAPGELLERARRLKAREVFDATQADLGADALRELEQLGYLGDDG